MKAIKFKSLSSGSCGNCYFLGIFEESDEGSRCECAVLVDAGVSPRRFKKELQRDGISLECISSILITHDHLDHIRSLGSYCKHLRLPVWLTPELSRVLSRHFMTARQIGGLRNELETGWNDIVPGRIRARYFVVPHDASQTVGYAVELDGYRFMIMTDAGRMTAEAASLASEAQTVVIESNYDEAMLLHGTYPPHLQRRILADTGHMDNAHTAEYLARIYTPTLRNIFLCHLSGDNNHPELAYKTVENRLYEEGIRVGKDVELVALTRNHPSALYTFEEPEQTQWE